MDSGLRKGLGARLRQARDASGLTQEDVAARLDVAPQTVWQWEDGRVAPMVDRLNVLASLYGVSVDWLLGRTNVSEEVADLAFRYSLTDLPEEDIDMVNDFIRMVRDRRRRPDSEDSPSDE